MVEAKRNDISCLLEQLITCRNAIDPDENPDLYMMYDHMVVHLNIAAKPRDLTQSDEDDTVVFDVSRGNPLHAKAYPMTKSELFYGDGSPVVE